VLGGDGAAQVRVLVVGLLQVAVRHLRRLPGFSIGLEDFSGLALGLLLLQSRTLLRGGLFLGGVRLMRASRGADDRQGFFAREAILKDRTIGTALDGPGAVAVVVRSERDLTVQRSADRDVLVGVGHRPSPSMKKAARGGRQVQVVKSISRWSG